MEHRCLVVTANRDEWIWNYRLGHLNFENLNDMQKIIWLRGFHRLICQPKYMKSVCRSSNTEEALEKMHDVKPSVISRRCIFYVYDPMQVDSIRGNRYFVTFIDDFSRKL